MTLVLHSGEGVIMATQTVVPAEALKCHRDHDLTALTLLWMLPTMQIKPSLCHAALAEKTGSALEDALLYNRLPNSTDLQKSLLSQA